MNKYMKMIGFALIGAIGCYDYYYFIGCNGGTCPITSNWYVTTLYGSMMGLVLGFPTKSKNKKNNNTGDDINADN